MNAGFRITCVKCTREIVVKNDFDRNQQIDIRTDFGAGYGGVNWIDVQIECDCENSVEFRTY